MNAAEAEQLVKLALPAFPQAGLPALSPEAIQRVTATSMARLWGGMGAIYELQVVSKGKTVASAIAKRVRMPADCTSIGDRRKKASYEVEAAFYGRGHAERLIAAGCSVPVPLVVETSRADGVTICMSKLPGAKARLDEAHSQAVLRSLAIIHALYWGPRADEATAPDPPVASSRRVGTGTWTRARTSWRRCRRPGGRDASASRPAPSTSG